ncbi:hypothetical protein NR402_14335 [Acidithiobacillus ferrooxidans]|uniref:hypothetical protein n=1 Tax=Acidithiobacillus ferrooxidans TaxID=920 RepID=UPI00214B1CF2|nr:hypothetical protein [Acidithiobacillus ferrooxidans]MCR2831451.1 hypothetical protein [Acidithiobacillus ferrooxidans]
MTKWIQKKVSIGRSTSIDCETIEYISSKSDFIRTATGQVTSINPGTLKIYSKHPIIQPPPSSGTLSFNDNGKLIMFRIIGIIERTEYLVVFSSLPEEMME